MMPRNFLAEAEKCFSHMSILIELSNEKKLTGYGIVAQMRKFGFDISPRTIYNQLERLSTDGIIRGKKQPWGKTQKIVYEMTRKGKEVFEEFKKRWERPLEYAYRNLSSSSSRS